MPRRYMVSGMSCAVGAAAATMIIATSVVHVVGNVLPAPAVGEPGELGNVAMFRVVLVGYES